MAARSSLKASDADRERVAERLRNAAAEGRLLAHELEQRMATALRARTYGELDAVVADLPGERVGLTRARPRSLRSLGPVPAIALVLALPMVFALVVAVVAIVFAMLTTWALLAAIVWMMLGHGRRWYGPRWSYARGRMGPPRHRGVYGPRRAPARPSLWL
jgi:Domain of unknown function (DUF1707)